MKEGPCRYPLPIPDPGAAVFRRPARGGRRPPPCGSGRVPSLEALPVPVAAGSPPWALRWEPRAGTGGRRAKPSPGARALPCHEPAGQRRHAPSPTYVQVRQARTWTARPVCWNASDATCFCACAARVSHLTMCLASFHPLADLPETHDGRESPRSGHAVDGPHSPPPDTERPSWPPRELALEHHSGGCLCTQA